MRHHQFAAAAGLAAALALVQPKPDFSGDWVLDRAASTLSPGADATESAVLHIEHAEPAFRIQARFVFTGGKPFEWSYRRVSDGKDVKSADGAVSSLSWDGDALVARDETTRAGAEVTMSWRYELVDAGRRLRATERLRAATHNQDNVWLFNRR